MMAHESQYFEWLPWVDRRLDEVPKDPAQRREWFVNWRGRPNITPEIRKSLEKWYGSETGLRTGTVSRAFFTPTDSVKFCDRRSLEGSNWWLSGGEPDFALSGVASAFGLLVVTLGVLGATLAFTMMVSSSYRPQHLGFEGPIYLS